MQFNNYIKSKLPFFVALSFALVLASCGSYQYVGNDNDGIYSEEEEVPYQETSKVEAPANDSYYKNYFAEKSEAYADIEEENVVFTDIDSYEGSYAQEEQEVSSYAGWGQDSNEVSIQIYSNWGSPWGWQTYGIGSFGWYNYHWGSPWGWNTYWCPPYYGYGYGYGYNFYNPYWSHGGYYGHHNYYGNHVYSNRGVAYNSGRRGSVINRNLNNTGRRNTSRAVTSVRSNSRPRNNSATISRPIRNNSASLTRPRGRNNSSTRPAIRNNSRPRVNSTPRSSTRPRVNSRPRRNNSSSIGRPRSSSRPSSSVRRSGSSSRSSSIRSSGSSSRSSGRSSGSSSSRRKN